MKNKMTVFSALGLGAVLFVFSGMTGAQEQKSQLYAITEILVKPAMVAQYEAAVKKEVELDYPFPFEAYSTGDFHYYFLIPIENYSGIDALNKAEGEWAAKIGAEFQALMKSVEGTIDYYKNGAIRFLPELSYAPKKPLLKPGEAEFIYWSHCYLEGGKEKEFADVQKQWVELYKSKDIPFGWSAYSVEMGAEGPYYVFASSAKNAAEFFIEDEKATKKMGREKVMELLTKTLAFLRRYEFKTGRPRPDLSNMPKK